MNLFLPRGIRNNNPGNIRLSKIKWKGQKCSNQIDSQFVEFISPLYGVRALMRLLLTYYIKYGLDSVEAIINRYAPPIENATDSYIYHICTILNVKRREQINLCNKKHLINFAKAITLHENGKSFYEENRFWYGEDVYIEAAKLALEKGK